MPNATLAQITALAAGLPGNDRRVLDSLVEALWSRVKILSRDGRPVYAGQAGDGGNPLILPSETRNLAEITRAVAIATPGDARLGVLRDGLVQLADGSGWGSTKADFGGCAGARRQLEAADRATAGDFDPGPGGGAPRA